MATFAKVVELNGFTAAARALRVPKATISRAIADLERALGVRLLTRTTRRIALTAAGQQLLPDCQEILARSQHVRDRSAEFTTQRSGPLRVAADPAWGRVLLSPLVPRFLEKYPSVPLEVDLRAPESLEPADWDVMIRLGRPPARADAEAWIVRDLGAPPSVLCATPTYLAKHGLPVRPEELERHALLLTTGDSQATGSAAATTLVLAQGLRRVELTLAPKLAVNDPALVHAAVTAGLGIGLLPEFLCRQGLAMQKLARLLPEWELPAQAPLCAVHSAALIEDARVRALVDFLAASIVPALA